MPASSETTGIPNPDETYLILPPHLEYPDDGYSHYTALDPMLQPHLLNEAKLTAYHHSLLPSNYKSVSKKPLRATHLMAGAWCQVELAHVVDARGRQSEAQELLTLAGHQAQSCQFIVERKYTEHNQYFDRYYRARLLGVYASHFAQLGPVHWPDYTTDFQRTAYGCIQEALINPLLNDLAKYKNTQAEGQLKGLLGEIVVLQVFNRLHATSESDYAEWAVAPASLRENSSGSYIGAHSRRGQISSAFDLKVVFSDQTFIPAEIKWAKPPSYKKAIELEYSYDRRIALIYANGDNYSASVAAHAMRHEVAHEPLSDRESTHLEGLTAAVLDSIGKVKRIGKSIYRADSLEAATAELSLQNLLLRAAVTKLE